MPGLGARALAAISTPSHGSIKLIKFTVDPSLPIQSRLAVGEPPAAPAADTVTASPGSRLAAIVRIPVTGSRPSGRGSAGESVAEWLSMAGRANFFFSLVF